MNEVSDELKNRIRCERILSIICPRVSMKNFAYYKNKNHSLKGINEEEFKKHRIQQLKSICLNYIKYYELFGVIKTHISDYETEFKKDMTEEEILLYTYRIYLIMYSGEENWSIIRPEMLTKTLDELEDLWDIYNNKKLSKKKWWNRS